jgi:threonylcarbamoyladenosine tRNA methylthiotransferase MtaB
VQDGCDYKCTLYDPLARGISRSDELNNVLKNAYEISQQNIKEILTGVNIEIMEKGNLEQKTRTYF